MKIRSNDKVTFSNCRKHLEQHFHLEWYTAKEKLFLMVVYVVRSVTPENSQKLALCANFTKIGILVLGTPKYDSKSGSSRSTLPPLPRGGFAPKVIFPNILKG